MGLMNCKIHGGIGVMPYISKKVQQAILDKENFDALNIKSLHVNFYGEGEIFFDRYYYFDEYLYTKLSLKDELEIVTDEDDLKLSNLLNGHLAGICVDCFKEYMNRISVEYKL